jgi:hypothetical protein
MYDDIEWNHVAEDRKAKRAVVNILMHLSVP